MDIYGIRITHHDGSIGWVCADYGEIFEASTEREARKELKRLQEMTKPNGYSWNVKSIDILPTINAFKESR